MKKTVKCPNCHGKTMELVTRRYETSVKHDGRTYSIVLDKLPHYVCTQCHDKIVFGDADDRIWTEVRNVAGLLQPHEIKHAREMKQMTQKQLSELMGVAESTICRWETGAQIQQVGYDRFMRLLFTLPGSISFCEWLVSHTSEESKQKNPFPLTV